jgi:uncharacterized protein (DUF736 family)
MAHIGAFTLKDGTWTGTIRTLTINVKAQLVPNKEKGKSKDAPTSGLCRRRRTRRRLAPGLEGRRDTLPRRQAR